MTMYCQMITEEGIRECGYLVGGKCRADPLHPFWVDFHTHNILKTVGCASWSRYLEYGRKHTVPELSVDKMGVCGNNPQNPEVSERRDNIPMHVLQKDRDCRRGDADSTVSPGCDLMANCDICGEKSVVREDDGHYYCYIHHVAWCQCISHEKMVETHERIKNEVRGL